MESSWRVRAVTVLFLLPVLFASPSRAQDVELLQKGVVKVTAMASDGTQKVGAGFIVRLGAANIYIVTASHVVEGARDVEVEFFVQRARPLPAKVIAMEGADPQGLAVLSIEGKVPTDVSVLKMNRAVPLRAGDRVTTIGFPDAGGPWAVTRGEIVGRKAKTIAFSGAVDQGNSGGPLIKDGQVIGVVTEALSPFAYAAPAVLVQYVLESWGVKFGDRLRSRPATLEQGFVAQMIVEKGFSHPGDISKSGFAGYVRGNFQHEYAVKTLNGDTVVIDHATGLMWQQSGSVDTITWGEAKEYIGELNRENFAGFSDWRLPTVEELSSLMESVGGNEGLYIDSAFDKNQSVCWSSDRTSKLAPAWAGWGVDYQHGTVSYLESNRRVSAGDGIMYARGVRSAELDSQPGAKGPSPKATPGEAGHASRLANTKIGFRAGHYGREGIFVMNADGTAPTRVSGEAEMSRAAGSAWSPDGTRVAFVADQGDTRDRALYVVNADGTNRRRVVDSGAEMPQPSWSPDGTRLAFVTYHECSRNHHVVNADGTNRRTVVSLHDTARFCSRAFDWSPAWAPDGAWLAFPSHREEIAAIHVVAVDGPQGKQLRPLLPGISGRYQWWLSWSPDGTRIAFTVLESDGTNGLYVMNSDGTNPTRLLRGAGSSSISWSPDGTALAFVSKVQDLPQIYTINADGSDQRQLTKTSAANDGPSWSPDGTKIAFASKRYGNWEIYVMNRDGSNPIRLTHGPTRKEWPFWSPFLK